MWQKHREVFTALHVLGWIGTAVVLGLVLLLNQAVTPQWLLVWLVASACTLHLISGQFSRSTLHVALVAASVLGLVMLIDLGSTATLTDADAARGEVVEARDGLAAKLQPFGEDAPPELAIVGDATNMLGTLDEVLAVTRSRDANDVMLSVAPEFDLTAKLEEAVAAGKKVILASNRNLQREVVNDLVDAVIRTRDATEGWKDALDGTDAPSVLDILPAIDAGAEATAGAIPGLGRSDQVGLGNVEWVLIGAGLLLFLRHLEIRSGRCRLGPVTIAELVIPEKPNLSVETTSTGPTAATLPMVLSDKDLNALFKRTVLRSVPEPGNMPGADAVAQLTDLLAVAGGAAGPLRAIGSTMAAVLGTTSGYEVDATVHHGTEARIELFVRVRDARSKETIDTYVTAAGPPEQAVLEAGNWAAASILGRSTVVPRWAQWTAESAPALASYMDQPASDLAERIKRLEEAVQHAPRCGVLLTRLGAEYDLAQRHTDALRLYLRASIVHPHYLIARYRLALSFSLVAADVEKSWWSALGTVERQSLLADLRRFGAGGDYRRLSEAVAAGGPRAVLEDPTVDTDELRRTMCEIGVEQLGAVTALLGYPLLTMNLLRRSERAAWRPFVAPTRGAQRRRMLDTIEVAKLTLQAREAPEPTTCRAARTPPAMAAQAPGDSLAATLLARHRAPDGLWQVLYNLACLEAIRAATDSTHATSALDLLEESLACEGAGQLSAEWARIDPDLHALEGLDRFKQFLNQLPQQEKDVA